jgi:hypothetical protein
MPRQIGIQSVRLVGVVADQTRRELADKSRRKCGVNQSDFMRRGTLDVDGAPCRSAIAMIFDPCRVSFYPRTCLAAWRARSCRYEARDNGPASPPKGAGP